MTFALEFVRVPSRGALWAHGLQSVIRRKIRQRTARVSNFLQSRRVLHSGEDVFLKTDYFRVARLVTNPWTLVSIPSVWPTNTFGAHPVLGSLRLPPHGTSRPQPPILVSLRLEGYCRRPKVSKTSRRGRFSKTNANLLLQNTMLTFLARIKLDRKHEVGAILLA